MKTRSKVEDGGVAEMLEGKPSCTCKQDEKEREGEVGKNFRMTDWQLSQTRELETCRIVVHMNRATGKTPKVKEQGPTSGWRIGEPTHNRNWRGGGARIEEKQPSCGQLWEARGRNLSKGSCEQFQHREEQ